jgi:hypothetical protein
VAKGFEAARPKSTVLKQPSTERPRCTPTSTLSAPSFIARRTISCRRNLETPGTGIELLERANRVGGEIVLGDKGYAGREFAEAAVDLETTILRPARKDEPANGLHLVPIRQGIGTIFWTCKDILTLERHGARTLNNLRVRIAQRMLALAACIALNHGSGLAAA